MKVNFNVNILSALLAQNERKAIAAATKFPKIQNWQQQTDKPTLKQLAGLAKYFSIPFGYFFLDNVPKKEIPIPHYRTNNRLGFKASTELLQTIEILKERQDWAKDVLSEYQPKLSFANSISTKTKIKDAVEILRQVLNVKEKWNDDEEISSWYDAFRFLVRRAERAGIFVVVNSVINYDNTKKLSLDEFRGFVLYDQYAPFIFINNRDFVTGKIFTIVHEIVHLLIGESASFDFVNLLPSNNDVETFCNAVAAEFLAPMKLVELEFKRNGADYERIARVFRVSRIVIARRLYDLGKITKDEFIAALNNFKAATTEKLTDKSKGGDFYNLVGYKTSARFFNLVYSNVKQGKMLYRDAFRITGLSPKAYDGYIKNRLLQ